MQAPGKDRHQAAFDKIGHMAMQVLSSPESADVIASDAKANGPAQAIANALSTTMDSITKAAAQSGVQLPGALVQEAKMTVAKVLAALMVQSGLASDPQQLMQELEPLLAGEPSDGEAPGHEPTNPADDAAEDASDPNEPPNDDMGERRGALMMGARR